MLNRDHDCLFVLLWWTVTALLWYIGVAVWVSIIIGALVGWVLRGILIQIGGIAIPYKITHGQVIMEMPIYFRMPLWRKLLIVLLPVKPEILKAEIRCLYEGSDTWWEETLWKETKSSEITIMEERTAHISVLQYNEKQALTIEGKPLPSKFSLDVRIKRVSNGKPIAPFTIPLEIN